MTRPTVSFEFFPPKTPEAEESLWAAMPVLAALGPRYMTVTYGAGGSTREGTLAVLSRAASFNIPLASHLTYLSTTRADLEDYLERLWDGKVRHIVALRGDLPKGRRFEEFAGPDYYHFTSDFVEEILKRHAFEISVAAYPDKHPDAPSLEADIEALRKKCAAGAARAITQFFFDNDKFYAFRDKCAQAGITTPLCPGLLPVHDYKSMVRFAGRCQAHVPDRVHSAFAGLENQPDEARKRAEDLLVRQALDLAENGVSHIHFYTLNKADLTRQACEALANAV